MIFAPDNLRPSLAASRACRGNAVLEILVAQRIALFKLRTTVVTRHILDEVLIDSIYTNPGFRNLVDCPQNHATLFTSDAYCDRPATNSPVQLGNMENPLYYIELPSSSLSAKIIVVIIP